MVGVAEEEEGVDTDVVDVDVTVVVILVVLVAIVAIAVIVAAQVKVLAIVPLFLPDRAAISNGRKHSRGALSAPENEPLKAR